ncbi:protein transport protein Sec61 subunit beta-like [Antedon mediterranea]|uniref:protein transport protein Sec61 subunit beta-like n=1 Tax=Antedon mediterranea TaxID=105859 RepID=UPI003AF9AE2C
MALPSASSTSVGSRSPSRAVSPKSGGSQVRNRGGKSSGTTRARNTGAGGGSSGMWRFYNEDSPGLKVGPVPVLVMSLIFIASVFMLHIWGKYTRA